MSISPPLQTLSTSAFSDLPPTPAAHFKLHLYAAVYRVLHYLRTLEVAERPGDTSPLQPTFERHPFLAHYFEEIVAVMPEDITWDDGTTWWEHEIASWEQQRSDLFPLCALTERGGLSLIHRTALIVAGLIEEDARFGSFFAEFQAPLPHRRPCLDLVGRIAGVGHTANARGSHADPWSICQTLIERGFAVPEDPTAPRAEWTLRVPSLLWDTLRGTPEANDGRLRRYAADAFPPIDDLLLPLPFLDRIRRLPSLFNSGEAGALVVRGRMGSDRLAVLGAVARALGVGVVEADGANDHSLLGPLCTLTGALPVLRFDHAPGETSSVPPLKGYEGPIGLVLGMEGSVDGPALEHAVTLRLPALRRAERSHGWRQALGPRAGSDLEQIAARFHLQGTHIRQAASVAIAQAALRGRQHVALDDARAACRTLGRHHLDTLAEWIEATGSWDQVVTSAETRAKLDELELRCRHRESLLDHLSAAFSVNRGVRALFSGPSGTGKTLAARVLAAELGMDLYRLDLAAVINKYIGETEKNLHRILATAEALDVILLIDEGDALLGGRTEVKSANDRYANLETNYLLQRLEHYDGIIVVTTNLGENVDRAFQRRMDVTVDFLPPQAEERRRIWALHLPEHQAIPDTVLDAVAARCHLTGGQIRNAALHAALHALDADAPVGPAHLDAALRSEYRKAGTPYPLVTATNGQYAADLDTFIRRLSP